MGFEYFVFYTEATAICILILLMILVNDRLYSSQQEKQIWFGRTDIAFIMYFVSDACWAAVLGGQIPRIRPHVVFFNLTNYFLLSVMAYEMFMFVAASEKMPFRKERRNRLLCFIPTVVSTLVMSGLYLADPYFWIDEANELNGTYYFPLMISVPSLYLTSALVCSVINAHKTDKREEKKLYLQLGVLPFGVMAFGMLQVVLLNAPTFCFGCTILWLWFYIQNMQTMISLDNLTGLNNRGQINRYMDQIRYRENTPVFIMMIDIDSFKGINDNYGHAEGDRALVLVAEALKQTCEKLKTNVFLGRYGGDEFTIIIQDPAEDEPPEQIARAIRSSLSDKWTESEMPYRLELSIGYSELGDDGDTMQKCMIRADEQLYRDKRRRRRP
ncbi:MAG: GGDEF domain-containing protein [Lachnospiraceae bacterium]|nr:GGDEF domain-containing protein [Lachnospiraceae bacterium]